MRPTLVVMVKAPRVGRVKTRLGRDLGMVEATWWYRHQTARLFREIRDPRWASCLAVAPDHMRWSVDFPQIPQGPGNLGDRMGRLLRTLCPALIIGSDIPAITRAHIATAFHKLRSADVVLGPATDGGYWAVGARRLPARAFHGVRWSTEHALADTVASLQDMRIAYASPLSDVDTAEDLARARF